MSRAEKVGRWKISDNNINSETTSYFGTSRIMAAVKLSDIITRYEDNRSGDFAEWLEKLELVAKLQNMSDLKSFLPLFLNGPAFAIYKQLSSEEKDDYEKMKAALLSAFGMNCYAAYDQLQRRVLQDGETVDVYLADLRRLVTLMGQSSPEPLLKCSFMAGLPSDVSLQLKSMAAVEKLELEGLVTRARVMLSTRNADLSCAVGYTKQRFACYTCGSPAHLARDCPQSTRKTTPNRNLRRCYECNEMTTHIARTCPKKQVKEQGEASAPVASPAQQ